MSNWFAGLGQAASGLNAARYGISVVGQNIANANSDGYTRQIPTQQSVERAGATGMYTRPGQDGTGGVAVTGTQRADDTLLDARVRGEHGRGAYADTTAQQLSALEQLFPGASDNGLSAQLTGFWADWATVADNPGSGAARGVLLQDATTVVGTLHGLSTSLTDLTDSTTSYLAQDVQSANTAATQLATLNGQIGVTAATGGDVNALLDKRDQLLDSLTKLTGAVATLNANGSADVRIGAVSLVSGTTATAISVDPAANVSVGSTGVTLTSGSAAARITALQVTFPAYRSRLDGVADALSGAVNAVQAAGYDLAGQPGTPLFTGAGAAGIAIAISDPSLVAASGSPGGNLDGTNAQAAARLGTAATGPDAAYSGLIGAVGAESAAAQNASANQQSIVGNLDALHSSVSGVSYDEEVAHMLTYQRAFDASSRALTTLDDMLDTLINHTGRAGLA